MGEELKEFADYLRKADLSENTVLAYIRDLKDFDRFLGEKGFSGSEDSGNSEVVAFLLHLRNQEKTAATINRKVAALRSFFAFLCSCGKREDNPAKGIRNTKGERKSPEYLTIEQVENLLQQPDRSFKGLRDRALLELLYASGMRVSEAAAANLEDVNLRIGFIVSGADRGKARLIPLGRPARVAVEVYLTQSRPGLVREKEEKALFVNYNGERLTRQGIWKMMKEYAEKAGLSEKLTPQILRNSFAVHMVQNGADLKTLQELLGHEDILATQIYLNMDKKKIKDVYDKTHPRA